MSHSLHLMAALAIMGLYTTDVGASIIKQYSLVLLQVDGRPYCRGILIDRTAFTAAHCIKAGKEKSILYIKEGRHLTAKPTKIVNLANSRNDAHSRDIAVLLFENSIDGDIDGSIDVSPHAVNTKTPHSQHYYFADKWLFKPEDQTFELVNNQNHYLYHRGSARNQLAFSLNPSRGVLGYFSDLNVTDKTKENHIGKEFESAENISVCHGHSGTPVFSEAYGVSKLVGIATAIDSSVIDKERKKCSDLFLADKTDIVTDKYLLTSPD